jgi:chaperonin GroEL (HSP60 family)
LNALKNALVKPTLTLLENAGFNGKYIVENIIEKQELDPYIGYDLTKGIDI